MGAGREVWDLGGPWVYPSAVQKPFVCIRC